MPKNIVLLSDGTGNSSAQLLKTNVWRVYESLQLKNPSVQVACYDDGVGTSSFKPLALLGGAVGIGLRGNVLRLYRFLCEYYDPGDRIFLFGFSRGAFTVRVLAGLICNQGIIPTRQTLPVEGATMAPDVEAGFGANGTGATAEAARGIVYGSDLKRLTRRAYRQFRRSFKAGLHVTAARRFGDLAVRAVDFVLRRNAYDQKLNHIVKEIAFIGVWDTVDAYGLPVDELTHGIDRWVWPLSMPDLELNEIVKRACQVLALDDERNTFHPLLWNEQATEEPQDCTHIDQERITQVWFAGMHSNVGGGYPDDALSAVSLAWMVQQVKGQLVFVQEMLEHHTAKADPLGRLYDSRSGLKGYYRYNPRRIEWLTNGQQHERELFRGQWPKNPLQVCIGRPKIHESVFTRMSAAPEAYAPIVFPEKYAVVMENGQIVDGNANPYEPSEAAVKRFAAQEAVWDLVWWRRIVYFAAVGVTLVVLALPIVDGVSVARSSQDVGTAGRIVAALGEWLPSFASRWIDYFTVRPWVLFLCLAIVIVLSRIGRQLQAKICHTMRGIWLKVIPPAVGQYTKLTPHTGLLKTLRSSKWYQGPYAVWRHKALPMVFGFAILVCLVALANRISFEVASAAGRTCSGGPTKGLYVGESRGPLMLASRDFCKRTGVHLEAGKRYEFRFSITPGANERWQDGDVQVAYSAEGFSSRTPGLTFFQRVLFIASTPFRRLWSADWFVPVARIGDKGITQYRLDAPTTIITAPARGELFLFVNDAIAPLRAWPPAWGWDAYYLNNRGAATVTVKRLPECLKPCPG